MAILADGPVADIAVIDGYVWLAVGRAGLGMHLHEALGPDAVVVGVAKTRFAGSGHAVGVVRGASTSPLYVTAVGIDAAAAAEGVRGMAGGYRVPTLLRQVDRLCRDAAGETPDAI